MKKVIKWLGIVLGAVVVLLLIAVGYIYLRSSAILEKTYTAKLGLPPAVPSDSASLAWGEHLANCLAMCTDCHGADFGGAKVIDDPSFARLYGPNLTHGKGGLPKSYSMSDFDRAVRHGVMHNGKGIWIMPSYHYCYMSDDDLGALYGYLRSQPPVDRENPAFALGPIGRMLLVKGLLPPADYHLINHEARRPPKPSTAPTAAYGNYLTKLSCVGCHGPDLSGGPILGAPPEWPPSANLTKGGTFAAYSEADFVKLLREGERPGGKEVNEIMPIRFTAQLTDMEIHALWLYLQTLPAKATGSSSWMTTKAP